MEEFKLFVKEVVNEMTVKAGQKCTAIRRTLVPENMADTVTKAVKERLSRIKAGDPTQEGIKMGALADKVYVEKVKEKLDLLKTAAEVVYEVPAESDGTGAFFNPVLLYCQDPYKSDIPHDVEAFGPVNTIMPYKDIREAIRLSNMGQGSLVASLFTADDNAAAEVVREIAPYHGRIVVINKESAKESTGHGSPLPHLVHGGPGRAGGGEEMGGIRGILKYMQRTALQGHPTTLTKICNQYIPGGEGYRDEKHPFKKYFDDLVTGEIYITHRRTVTETDVVNFAGISGDFFYAHMDELAAKDSMFEKRVAHGYFVLSAAAGLFVDPAPGPVIANYGLEGLRFTQPVYIGDTIHAKLVCKKKIKKEIKEDEKPQGIVEWYVEVLNQHNEMVAVYTILTLVARKV
jgi:oxepin-CoA hydrolase/3-oxo-5,6-dehydrosuberyl-CoA semialdehyde dehydrogenase